MIQLCAIYRSHTGSQRHKQVESKWIKKIHRVNGNHGEPVAVLISDDIDFKALLLDRRGMHCNDN